MAKRPDELGELERLRDFARSMLDPERFGLSVTAEVRDEARDLLGLKRVETGHLKRR